MFFSQHITEKSDSTVAVFGNVEAKSQQNWQSKINQESATLQPPTYEWLSSQASSSFLKALSSLYYLNKSTNSLPVWWIWTDENFFKRRDKFCCKRLLKSHKCLFTNWCGKTGGSSLYGLPFEPSSEIIEKIPFDVWMNMLATATTIAWSSSWFNIESFSRTQRSRLCKNT